MLVLRRRPHDVSGFQILRCRARIGRRDNTPPRRRIAQWARTRRRPAQCTENRCTSGSGSAIVIPDTGLDDDRSGPTMRDDTVTRRSRKILVRSTRHVPCVGMLGATTGRSRAAASAEGPRSSECPARTRGAAAVFRAEVLDAGAEGRDDRRDRRARVIIRRPTPPRPVYRM